jgi:hypothetical protein
MMVIPTEGHVTLYYGRTLANTIGQVLEVLGWILLLFLTVWRLILWRRRKKLAGAVQESRPILGDGLEEGTDADEWDPGESADPDAP